MITKKQLMEVLDLVEDDTLIFVWVDNLDGDGGYNISAEDVHIEPNLGILIGTSEGVMVGDTIDEMVK